MYGCTFVCITYVRLFLMKEASTAYTHANIICVYIYRHIHIHTLHTHTYTAFEIRLYVRMYACMSAHVFNYTGIHMYSGLHMHAYIRECMYQSVGVRATMHSIAQNRKRSFQSADPTLIFRVT